MATFIHQVVQEIIKRSHDYVSDNWDDVFFGPNPVAHLSGQIVLDIERSANYLVDMIQYGQDYEWLNNALEDNQSRRLLIDLLTYRVLGYAHVKLPFNTDRFWQEYRTIDSRFLREANVAKSGPFTLNRYAISVEGRELNLVGHPLSMLALLAGQYYYQRNGVRIQPEPGDVVIDGGGCWGEVAIAFAVTVGEQGKVFSFEFVPENVEILQTSLCTLMTDEALASARQADIRSDNYSLRGILENRHRGRSSDTMGRSKKPMKATAPSHSTRNRWLAAAGLVLVIGLVAAVLLIDRSSDTAPNPSEAQRLVGRWERQDGGYVLEIRQVAADGQAEASYFNPNPIHVAQARVKQQGASVGVFIELQGVGYPGSTYTLTYDAPHDELQGTYFQAAANQQFPVTFIREK